MRKPFPRKYDFAQIERDVEEFWKNQKLVPRAIQYESGKPLFSWLEGPPTANAPPGLHHVEVRVFKDLNLRYKHMQGFTVPRKGGWDCHGLPVEVQVEKKLHLGTKKEVINFGIGKFNEMCKKDVFSYIKDWEKLTDKMAFWVDLQHPYVTMENDYIESVWWSLKELYEKGLLYEGHKVVPYCPRCETPLSSHEVALGYKEVSDPAITVKFKVPNSRRAFLAWTTTPWTLPSNVALAVNPSITYVAIEHDGEELILAKELAAKYFENPVIVKEFTGSELVGTQYEPVFDYFKTKVDLKRAWKVIPAQFVSTTDGTGIVHIAPAFGEDDYAAARENNMEFIQPVAENGTFTEHAKDFAGIFVKDADPKIIEMLQSKGAIIKKEKYTHNYPFCWRCSTPLLYYATKSWFIKVSAYRDRLLANNEKIAWYPEHIKHGRFGNWLEGAKDWALSRKKFWGTPLPIWRCTCGEERAIGSIKELRDDAIKLPKEIDLHRPHIDEIKLNCKSCGSEMARVDDVIDTWYDSGSAPFAQFHYPFENKELFEKSFPYDFITEAIDQTRGWFYTMHVISTLLFDSPAYRSCLVAGHVVDDNGEKMSKSKGNIINPWEAFDKVGVDAVRLQFVSNAPESPKRFGYESLNESTMPFLTILWNSLYFVDEYLASQNIDGKEAVPLQPEDEWLLSVINKMVKEVTENLDAHEYDKCISAIKQLVMDDFSRWYIKLVRDRASEEDKALAYACRYLLERLTRILAPFAPYLSDKLFGHFEIAHGSVHMNTWPSLEPRNLQLEEQMDFAQRIVTAALGCRDKAGQGVRWPLCELYVQTSSQTANDAVKNLVELIKQQTNIKEIIVGEKFSGAKTTVKPDAGKIGASFARKTPLIVKQIEKEPAEKLAREIEEKSEITLTIEGEKITLKPEHLIISNEVPKDTVMMLFDGGCVFLNTKMTHELEVEGRAREITRRVQDLRKNAGLSKKDRIELHLVFENPKEMHGKLLDDLKAKVGANIVHITREKPEKNFAFSSEEKIRGTTIGIFLSQIPQ